MDARKIYLTKEGLDNLKKEHEDLVKKKRPQVVEAMSQARNQGDLAENAEYHAAKEELSFIDGRIDELEEMLKQVVIIEENNHKGSGKKAVVLGSSVTVEISGKKHSYTVVGEWEADPQNHKISHESPIGKALIGKTVGEKIEVEAPAGKILYTVVSVE
jgi:transcription elongation factor GreA